MLSSRLLVLSRLGGLLFRRRLMLMMLLVAGGSCCPDHVVRSCCPSGYSTRGTGDPLSRFVWESRSRLGPGRGHHTAPVAFHMPYPAYGIWGATTCPHGRGSENSICGWGGELVCCFLLGGTCFIVFVGTLPREEGALLVAHVVPFMCHDHVALMSRRWPML